MALSNRKIVYFVMIGITLLLCLVGYEFLRSTDKSCLGMSIKDASGYIDRNLTGSGFVPLNEKRDIATVIKSCRVQPRTSTKLGEPTIIDVCFGEKMVGYAEVYQDCGIEWKRASFIGLERN